ncbi:MAG: DinB family protein [Flavobacteriales bacterium]|nr:DinB family protein [Flavobacteriales bacterium]
MENLSLSELNHIPEGFSNNIIWNFGHIVVIQQLLCYRLSGLETLIHEQFIDSYKNGSKPVKAVGQDQYDIMKELSGQLIEKFIYDLKEKKFGNYRPYTTQYNITIQNIQEAIHFNAIHESLHLGYALALRKAIKVGNQN